MDPHRALVVCLLTAALALCPRLARACAAPPDCPDSVAERREMSDVVFRGTVLDYHEPWISTLAAEHGVRLRWLPDIVTDKLGRRSAEFELVEAWKGVRSKTVRIYSRDDSCGWGMGELEPGMDMLVFARRFDDDNRIWTSVCYRPVLVESEAGQEGLAGLGPGRRDLPRGVDWWLERLGAIVLGLGAFVLVWFGGRHVRRQRVRRSSD